MLQWLKNKFKKEGAIEQPPFPVKVTIFDLEIPWDRNGVRIIIRNGFVRLDSLSKELYEKWNGGVLTDSDVHYLAMRRYEGEVRMLDRQVNRKYYDMGGK